MRQVPKTRRKETIDAMVSYLSTNGETLWDTLVEAAQAHLPEEQRINIPAPSGRSGSGLIFRNKSLLAGIRLRKYERAGPWYAYIVPPDPSITSPRLRMDKLVEVLGRGEMGVTNLRVFHGFGTSELRRLLVAFPGIVMADLSTNAGRVGLIKPSTTLCMDPSTVYCVKLLDAKTRITAWCTDGTVWTVRLCDVPWEQPT